MSVSGRLQALVRTVGPHLPSRVRSLLPDSLAYRVALAGGGARSGPAPGEAVPVEFAGRPYAYDDRGLVDYPMEQLRGTWFRGPLTRGPGAIAWLGAAQTFGRYVDDPFPAIVGRRIGFGTLNLGGAGTSPEYYLRHPELLDEASRCPVAVVQVMSARGIDNSAFRSAQGRVGGVRTDTGAPTESVHVIDGLLARGDTDGARRLVRESQRAWVEKTLGLLGALDCRTVLLYVSFDEPPDDVVVDGRVVRKGFPQLVDADMVRSVTTSADRFVSVVSRAGIPQAVRDARGTIVRVNEYYPGPEIHGLVADALTPVVEDLLS
jgi:hypothetical protein